VVVAKRNPRYGRRSERWAPAWFSTERPRLVVKCQRSFREFRMLLTHRLEVDRINVNAISGGGGWFGDAGRPDDVRFRGDGQRAEETASGRRVGSENGQCVEALLLELRAPCPQQRLQVPFGAGDEPGVRRQNLMDKLA